MSENTHFEQDLASIRSLMERSVKFISLSGLAGILAGIYALLGSVVAYKILYFDTPPFGYRFHFIDEVVTIQQLLTVAIVVLVLSISTGLFLSYRKAQKANVPFWGPASRQLLFDVAIPLVSGGLFILVMVSRGYFGIIAPASLIFYGLALIAGGRHTFTEIRFLGMSEIILGLLCALAPGYGLLCWAIGFGIMHIVYGTVMHFRYERG